MTALDTPSNEQRAESSLPQGNDRVLLVDDNPTNLRVLAQSLTGQGLTLLVANSGEEAMKIAAEARPALILLDINMPGIGGFETCRRLKADPGTADAVVVFLSARDDTEDKVRGLELGAADYISKPFNLNEVLARVRTHLETHRKHQELVARARPTVDDLEPDQLLAMIRAGESDRFELKSTLRWNLKADRAGKEIENAWLKTIVAFLNTDGGVLVVGVDDEGLVLGIEPDRFPNGDRYLLHANNLIRNTIGPDLTPFIRFAIKPLDGKEVFVVECRQSPSPVFLKRDGDEAFYIRLGPGSRKLLASEILAYVQSREAAATDPNPTSEPVATTCDAVTAERILMVDDTPTNLQVLYQTLDGHNHELLVARSGEEAIKTAGQALPSLILLDIMMPPGIDGYETCRRLKGDQATRDIPVIFMSALDETKDKVCGFQAGAVDYISKPFKAEEVIARVKTQLKLRRLQTDLARANAALRELNDNLEQKVEQRTLELMKSREAVIFGLAKLAESRDDDTGKHLDRICRYVEILASAIAVDEPELDELWVRTMTTTAALHDIGKVGIPDSILLKPGRLIDEEFDVIRRHTTIGGDTLMALKRRWGDDSFLVTAMEIVFAHHERWDGAGYPFGLAGEAIPRAGRVCAVADVYDALRSRRGYKPAMSHEEAREIIVGAAGSQFDPAVVKVFLAVEEQFQNVANDMMTVEEAT